MKKRRKQFLISAALSVMFLSLIPGNISHAEKVDSTDSTDITVLFRQTYKVDWSLISENEKQKTIESTSVNGWKYNQEEEIFERFVPYENVEVSLENSNESIKTDANGTVKLNHDNDTDKEVVNISVDGVDENLEQVVDLSKKEVTIVKDLDISQMLSDSEKDLYNEAPKNINTRASSTDPYWSVGESGVYGKRLHCNRFNGPGGNRKYYPNHYPQAWANFAGSDCDYALGRSTNCLADYGSNPYCAAAPATKQAKCSTMIGHYNRYHNH
ncbi:hypothetical protein IGI01_26140 [Bacillus thuringiensis]|nr:hypothetical protein [Bacillus thuringiensis]